MRSSSAVSTAWCAAARSCRPTPVSGRPNRVQLANGKAAIRPSSVWRARCTWASGSQAWAHTPQGSSALSTLMAACLSSGWSDCGQRAAVVSAFTPARRLPVLLAPPSTSSPQCMAMNTWPLRRPSPGCTGASTVPLRLVR
jgi:hypothetical protein